MRLFRWLCWLRAVWRNVTAPPAFTGPFAGALTSGHDYRVTDDWDVAARVDVLRCDDCGESSVGWRRVSP